MKKVNFINENTNVLLVADSAVVAVVDCVGRNMMMSLLPMVLGSFSFVHIYNKAQYNRTYIIILLDKYIERLTYI